MEIFDAILEKDILRCLLLLESMDNMELRIENHSDDRTMLMDMCVTELDVVAERALELGANPNNTDGSGWTALHYCMSTKENRCVELLLKHGADPNVKTDGGETSLMIAESNGDVFIVNLLKQYSADE